MSFLDPNIIINGPKPRFHLIFNFYLTIKAMTLCSPKLSIKFFLHCFFTRWTKPRHSDRFHNRVAKLKLAQRMAMKGVNKEWFDKHVEVIL